ncbi:TonB-dependent receptor [Motilimonas cestriensis]|uniref:TonB-dependent receptor n=1 Tax=Motilimonas cestriensis TaxID=2742685 RepID=A0ABS8WFF6_9GAMM|nr:TonB-dependent receptor [Motilimonas cestriensis]MCE2597000.1 TonB-dependent receptor [Motilimonas cestriensis]
MNQIQGKKQFSISLINQALLAAGLLSSCHVMAAQANNEAIVITATQTKHTELTAPASVSYITREELDKLNVNDVAQAIKHLPGINVNPGTSYGRNEIKIRGLDSDYTLLLVNGRRVNSRDALTSGYGNDFDLSTIPMTAVERIEVIRGPMSSLYGADALGGVVNVILRQPSETTNGSVGYQFDGITQGQGGDTNKVNAYISGALVPEKLLANLIIEKSDRDAWRTKLSKNPDADALEAREKLNIYSNVKWLLSAEQDVDLDLIYSKDDRDADWNNWGRAVNNVQELERINAALTHKGYWSAFDSTLRYSYESTDLMDNSGLNKAVGDVNQTNQAIEAQLSGYIASHLVTGGAEYRKTKLENNLTLGSNTVDYDQSAIYIQDEFDLGELSLTVGGRFDDHQVYGGEFSPRAYAVYSITDRWVVKGGIGKAFKAPGLNQYSDAYGVTACRGACTVVGNPDLKAETSVSYELSTGYEAEQFGGSLTLFNNEIEDMIKAEAWDRVKTSLSYMNVDKATIRGIELSAWFDVSDSLSINTNYLLSDSEDNSTGKELTLTPRNTWNAQLDWQAMENLSTFLAYNYTGSQFLGTSLSQEKASAYSTLDVGAQYEAIKNLTFKAGVTNLTDEDRDDIAVKYDYILKGRSIYAGVAYDF